MNGKCFCLISFILAVNFLTNARGCHVYGGAIQFSPFECYTDPNILKNIVAAQLRPQYSNPYGAGVCEYTSPLGLLFGGLRNFFWNTVSRLYPLVGAATNTTGKTLKDLISHSDSLRRHLSRVASSGLRGLNKKSMEPEDSDKEEESDEDPEENKKKGNRKKKQSAEEPSEENSDEDNEDDRKKNKKNPKEKNLDDLFS